MKYSVEELFQLFAEDNHLDIKLSYAMPVGYEDAFGTFDVTVGTLFFNKALLESRPEFEALFYFYHELRHALQYIFPESFPESIRRSIRYVILYNGTCFKLVDGAWKNCRLAGREEHFTRAYMNMPCELDANRYGRDMAKSLLPEYGPDIEALFYSWLPQESMSEDELASIFRQIDSLI